MLIHERKWTSDNGKYYVKVKKYDDDQLQIMYRIIVDGKKKPIKKEHLPKYVLEKIDEMRQEAEEVEQ